MLEVGEREVIAARFSPDGTKIACGCSGGPFTMWDTTAGRQTTMLEGSSWEVRDARFSPDCRTIAGVSGGMCHYWDVGTGNAAAVLAERWVTSVCFSPNGGTLAYGSPQGITYLRAGDPSRDRYVSYLHTNVVITPLCGIEISRLDFSLAEIDRPDKVVLR